MKNSIFAKTFGFALAASVVSSGLLLPAATVSANTADDTADDSICTYSLDDASDHVPGQLIVSTKDFDLAAVDSIDDAIYSVEKLDYAFNDSLYHVECDADLTAEEIEEIFSDSSKYEYVQYNYYYDLDLPDDSVDAGTGLEYAGWQIEYTDAANAWNVVSQNAHSRVRVGIVDQGVKYTHPEFEGIINVDLCYDAYYEEPLTSKGFGYHGTHVAGIVAATNSGDTDACRGIASGYGNDLVELVSINVFPSGSTGTTSEPIARGIQKAVELQCRIINMSLGGSGFDLLQQQAVGYAYDNGLTLCCAAGNNSSQSMHHPGDYPECICVIACDAWKDISNNSKASYSNYGVEKEVCAPGTAIYSTTCRNNKDYENLNGTSMATPVVTGVAALMLSVNPSLTNIDIKNIMQFTATDLYTQGFDIYTAYGCVNANLCVLSALSAIPHYGRTAQQDFIWRLYDIILDRYPDDSGYAHWQEEFANGATGSDVVRCFCLSQELQNKKLSDDQFITVLYRAIFNRAPDDAGFEQWSNFLYCGGSREGLVAHFINSQEFANLCAAYGLPVGLVAFPTPVDMNPNTLIFVYRTYLIALGRKPDASGKAFWCEKINSGELSAGDFTANVFMSTEYRNKNKDIYDYIEDLYWAFFERDPDADGFYHWYDLLSAGYDRDAVLSDFIHSQEFINLCASYGVRPF